MIPGPPSSQPRRSESSEIAHGATPCAIGMATVHIRQPSKTAVRRDTLRVRTRPFTIASSVLAGELSCRPPTGRGSLPSESASIAAGAVCSL